MHTPNKPETFCFLALANVSREASLCGMRCSFAAFIRAGRKIQIRLSRSNSLIPASKPECCAANPRQIRQSGAQSFPQPCGVPASRPRRRRQCKDANRRQSNQTAGSCRDISASPPPDAPCIAPGASTPNHSLSIDQGKSQISRRSPATATIRPAHARRVLLSSAVETDQWWTTDQVCAFLKLGRKAIWERRRNPLLEFPKPANLGGGRNHYRASAIRDWAERMALASLLAD